MPLLSNEYFDPERLVRSMKEKFDKNHQSFHLDGVKKIIKSLYFDSELGDIEVLNCLREDKRFNEYEYLRSIFSYLFSDEAAQVSSEERLDHLSQISGSHWHEEDTNQIYQQLNEKYSYFQQSTPAHNELFRVLSNSFRTMIVFYGYSRLSYSQCLLTLYSLASSDVTSLFSYLNLSDLWAEQVTNQAHICAYASMALFVDSIETQSVATWYAKISFDLDKLFRTRKNISMHKHDFYFETLSEKLSLSDASQLKDLSGWRRLIKNVGVECFPAFEMASQIERLHESKAPEHLEQAERLLATIVYHHGEKDPELAYLCYKEEISDDRFSVCLNYIQSGWPKKNRDYLPECHIQKHGFHFLKMRRDDKRTLFLGDLTHNCMSLGGDANGGIYSVRDAVERENNGFYVLLDKNKKIIGMCYAWMSRAGNLCIDSIEILRHSIKESDLFEILTLFSEKVLETHPHIQRVNLGSRSPGQRHFDDIPYKYAAILEIMREGFAHRDSSRQYCVKSRAVRDGDQAILDEFLWYKSHDFSACVVYLYEQFHATNQNFISELKQLLEDYPELTTQLTPKNIERFFSFSSALCLSDLKPLSPDDFQHMSAELRKNIPTARLAFWNDDLALVNVLNLISKEDIFPLLGRNQRGAYKLLEASLPSSEAFAAILSAYPVNKRADVLLETLNLKAQDEFTVRLINYPETLLAAIILLPAESHFRLCQISVIHKALIKLSQNPILLKKYVSSVDPETGLRMLTSMRPNGDSMLHAAMQSPETVEIVLNAIPLNQRKWALHQQYTVFDKTPLETAIEYPGSVYRILSCLPDPLEDVLFKSKNGDTLLHCAVHHAQSMKDILLFIPDEKRLEILSLKGAQGETVLERALRYPLSGALEELFASLPEKQRLSALIQRDKQGGTVLHRLVAYPKLMIHLIQYLPDKQQTAVLNVTNQAGEMPFDGCKDLEFISSIEDEQLRQKLMKWALKKLFTATDTDKQNSPQSRQ
jgi:hypothetical protein